MHRFRRDDVDDPEQHAHDDRGEQHEQPGQHPRADPALGGERRVEVEGVRLALTGGDHLGVGRPGFVQLARLARC